MFFINIDSAQTRVAAMAYKCGREELPHVRGQGQKPGGPHALRAAAKRSYPTSVIRGSGWEELPHTPKPKATGGSRADVPHAPTPEATGGGREDQPHAQGQGRRPGGPTPHPRSPGYVGAGGPRGAIPC